MIELCNEEINYTENLKAYKKHTHKQIRKINNNIIKHLEKKAII
jgi:hypothetical protein